jgi:hypothetical protein
VTHIFHPVNLGVLSLTAPKLGQNITGQMFCRTFVPRNWHVALCDQRRLACSVGGKPTGVTVRSPVVRIAERRETKTLKPIDKVSLGEIYESPGRNNSERECGLESA